MKLSQVTLNIVKDFCGVSDNDSDNILNLLMSSASDFIKGYTGLTAEQIDDFEDITDAYLILVNDMFSCRDYTLSLHKQVNPAVKTILGMHAVNYL